MESANDSLFIWRPRLLGCLGTFEDVLFQITSCNSFPCFRFSEENLFLNKIHGHLNNYFVLSLRSPLVAMFLKQIKTVHSVGYKTIPNCGSGSLQSLD